MGIFSALSTGSNSSIECCLYSDLAQKMGGKVVEI